jgi:hypothetical protein
VSTPNRENVCAFLNREALLDDATLVALFEGLLQELGGGPGASRARKRGGRRAGR